MTQTIEVPIEGMDCADCAAHVQKEISAVPYVLSADVLLGAEKAVIQVESLPKDQALIHKAVERAGYRVPEASPSAQEEAVTRMGAEFTDKVTRLFGMVFGAVLLIVVVGEWLGVSERITESIPWYVGLGVVLLTGYPVFVNVIRATLRGKIIAHTLTTMGLLAAVAVGEWATAAVVVFFMRVGDYAESFTAERARRALKELSSLAPQTARVLRGGEEVTVPVEEVQIGETVVVRPGEKIPVDGEVLEGHATANQATITGEGRGRRSSRRPSPNWGACGCAPPASGAIPPSGASSRWWRRPKRTAPKFRAWLTSSPPGICPWWRPSPR